MLVNTSLLPQNKIKVLDISEKTVTKVDGHYSLGLLSRDEFPNLLNNRSLALSRFLSLEKKFKNNPEFINNTRKLLKSILKRDTQQKLKMEITQITYPTPPRSGKYKQTR